MTQKFFTRIIFNVKISRFMVYHKLLFFCTLVIAINEAGDQASFGQGNGPVFLSNLGCTGNESSLLNCSNQGIGVVYCLDFNDVGVICPSGTCKY